METLAPAVQTTHRTLLIKHWATY